VRDSVFLSRENHQILLGIVNRLADSGGNISAFSYAYSHFSFTVADSHGRPEAETTSALNHPRHPRHVEQAVIIVFFLFSAVPATSPATVPSAIIVFLDHSVSKIDWTYATRESKLIRI